ncbi:MAG: Holliday junction branch migration protein RuvA [Acidobacteria bacterium]|nr:Holliday junction branch migration protein RuvA [Acidobacteriota bacterium]
MIAHLRGKLLSKKPNRVIVETGGVGYEVSIPVSTFYELGEEGTEVSLRVFTHVREDALSLYGFRTDQEKRLFERLIAVAGVGPKLAITILSGLEMDELVPAIRESDVARLLRIPGVGKKTAERLVLELRDKLMDLEIAAEKPEPASATELGRAEEDALSALVNLGYARGAAEAAVREAHAASPNGDFEQLLRSSLRLLARRFFS